jgi:hypothetical protein
MRACLSDSLLQGWSSVVKPWILASSGYPGEGVALLKRNLQIHWTPALQLHRPTALATLAEMLLAAAPSGVRIKVDLAKLIEKIYVSPKLGGLPVDISELVATKHLECDILGSAVKATSGTTV